MVNARWAGRLAPRPQRVLVPVCVALAYLLVCLAFVHGIGPALGAVSILAVVAATAGQGVRGGLVAALLCAPLSTLLVNLTGPRDWGLFFAAASGPSLITIALLGQLRDLSMRLTAERHQRTRVETDLRGSEVRFRALEDALRERERSAHLLFVASPLPMWVYDLETLRFQEVNDAALALYGFAREEFLQMRLTDLQPPALGECLGSEERPLAPPAGGSEREGRWHHRTRDGRLIDVEVSAHTIELAGRPAALMVSRDVTEQMRAQRAAEQAERAAEELARVRSDFVATINHELRTPLTAIIGYAELLGEHWERLSEPRKREQVARILAAAERQRRLVEDLVLARLNCDELQPRHRVLHLSELVRLAATTVCSSYPGQLILIPAECSIRAWGDAEWVVRILLHLLDNAAKCSAHDSPVAVSWAEEDKWAVVRVRDSGPGVPAGGREQLFSRFGRMACSPIRAGHVGAGLGLYLGRQLALAMGGDLDLEATGTSGSTFRLRLPRVPSEVSSDPSTP